MMPKWEKTEWQGGVKNTADKKEQRKKSKKASALFKERQKLDLRLHPKTPSI